MLNQLISGLKKKFSITIFHKKKIAIFCGTFYFAPKALKQSIWSFWVLFLATKQSYYFGG